MNDEPYKILATKQRSRSTQSKIAMQIPSFFSWTVGIAMTMIVLFLAIVSSAPRARSHERLSHCLNNLTQIGRAIHSYHVEHKSLPPTYTVDSEGKPLHSWRTLLLPYIDRQDIYKRLDLSKPWNDPANLAVFKETNISVYSCLSFDEESTLTNYLAVSTPEGAFPGADLRSSDDMKDGLSNTVWVVEMPREHAVPWYEPRDADEAMILELKNANELPHRDGMMVLLADGSSSFIAVPRMTDDIWRRLIDIDDGEPVEIP